MRYYVTGTDTDVGKTLVVAAAAGILRQRHERATVVKIVQTGLAARARGDAQVAADLAACSWVELARFPKPADPWTAAADAGDPPVRGLDVAARIGAVDGPLVVEGSGGAAVPLNEHETITDAAARCDLGVLLVVGLRLGCLSHAILTLEYLQHRDMPLRGIVCCERWPVDPSYPADVRRVLARFSHDVVSLPFEPDPKRRYRAAVAALEPILSA